MVTVYVGIGGETLKKDISKFCKRNHLTMEESRNDIVYQISGNFWRVWKLHRHIKKLQKNLFRI